MTRQRQPESRHACGRGLLGDGKDLSAKFAEAVGGSEQEWTAAGNHNSFSLHRPTVFGQREQAAGPEDAGQRPTRKRQKQFARAGGQDQMTPANNPRPVLVLGQENARARTGDDRSAIQNGGAGSAEAIKPPSRLGS